MKWMRELSEILDAFLFTARSNNFRHQLVCCLVLFWLYNKGSMNRRYQKRCFILGYETSSSGLNQVEYSMSIIICLSSVYLHSHSPCSSLSLVHRGNQSGVSLGVYWGFTGADSKKSGGWGLRGYDTPNSKT